MSRARAREGATLSGHEDPEGAPLRVASVVLGHPRAFTEQSEVNL